jgi:hypothetical protein
MSGTPRPDPEETIRQLEVDLAGINDSIDESRALIERSRGLRSGDDEGAGAAAS